MRPELDSPELFRSWLTSVVGSEPPGLNLGILRWTDLDQFAKLRLILALEDLVKEPYPDQLLDAVETIEDWLYFARVKASHANPETQ